MTVVVDIDSDLKNDDDCCLILSRVIIDHNVARVNIDCLWANETEVWDDQRGDESIYLWVEDRAIWIEPEYCAAWLVNVNSDVVAVVELDDVVRIHIG